jgi:hypothetical protein
VSVVKSIGTAERQAMQTHLAVIRHRKFSEHIEYGGALVISWASMSAGIVVALDITNDLASQMREHIYVGDFGPVATARLKALAEAYPDFPVLAMHRHDGVRGLWHAIHQGSTYTVLADYDNSPDRPGSVLHQTESGVQVILAYQGCTQSVDWIDTVPTKEEIEGYQQSEYFDHMPAIVRSVESENITGGAVVGVTYATTVKKDGEEVLLYIAPDIPATPRENLTLLSKLPYLRARVVASMSSAGYWHTSLRGVAFRAYLRDCYWGETVWTGGVIGWRLSQTTTPTYHTPISRATGVKSLLVMGGFNDVDQLSAFSPDMFSSGHKVVCESNTETYAQAFRVPGSYRDDILNANDGRRFHTFYTRGSFLDFNNGPVIPPLVPKTSQEAKASLLRMLAGDYDMSVW